MSLPRQLAAYSDCEAMFARANRNRAGSRFNVPSEAAAWHLRMRLHHYRVLLRHEASRIYPPESPAHNKSEYDRLICRLLPAVDDKDQLDGTWWIYIETQNATILAVEDLDESDYVPVFDEPKQLTFAPGEDLP